MNSNDTTTQAQHDVECQFCPWRGTFAEGVAHRRETQHLLRTREVAALRQQQGADAHQAQLPPRVWISEDEHWYTTPDVDGGAVAYIAEAGSRTGQAEYQRRLYDECVTAGWDSGKQNSFAEEIAHLHEELSEAFRAFRLHKDFAIRISDNGKPEGIPIELADVLIGLFYNAELHGFDLFAAVEQKHQYNLTRDYNAEGRQLHSLAVSPAEDEKCASQEKE